MKIIILSLGMIAQFNDQAVIKQVQQLTQEPVMAHFKTLYAACKQFNKAGEQGMRKEQFKALFQSELSISDDNMEKFEAAWNYIDLATVEGNVKHLMEFYQQHQDEEIKFLFISDTNDINLPHRKTLLQNAFAELNVNPEMDIFASCEHEFPIQAAFQHIEANYSNNDGVIVWVPNNAQVEIKERQEALNKKGDDIITVSEDFGARVFKLEGSFAESDLDASLRSGLRP